MNIDERDIETGVLPDILPAFHPGSISYLSELIDYRMYAEVWSNKRCKEGEKRKEIGHVGYLKTLEFGEKKKKRKSDKIRFNYFVVADSINYKRGKDIYGKSNTYIQMGDVQTNIVFNKITEANGKLYKIRSLYSNHDFHSKGYIPETNEICLEKLGLRQDKNRNKYYFEIFTNVDDISNQNQKNFLLQVLGREDIFKKLRLLYKAGRKHIRCFFENPENVIKNMGMSNPISRLCVAWPFNETMVFDFAGTLEDYGEMSLHGTLIKTTQGTIESEVCSGVSQIDSYA